MKHITLTLPLALAFSLGGAFAQSTNYALDNPDGTGYVSALTVKELDNSHEATFQMWVKAEELAPATLLAQDNFSISINDAEQLVVAAGDAQAVMPAAALASGWTQLTIVVDEGKVTAYMNNRRQYFVTGSLPAAFAATAYPENARPLVIGKGLKGEIDEVRIWTRALEQTDFCWRNTLNKYHPEAGALAAYWKCDQAGCPNLYDYAGGHHGVFEGGMERVAVTDNAQFKYRVVTGYTDLMRFLDRANINRDMYLMTNDVVILSAKVQDDGSVLMQYPDNSMTGTAVAQLPEWEGRHGVIDFAGEEALMQAADAHCVNDPRGSSSYQAADHVTFEGWFYVDEWREGAELFSQYQDASNCFVVSLGSEAGHELCVDVCGTTATLSGALQPGKWQYVAVWLTPAAGQAGQEGWSPVKIAVGEDGPDGFTAETYDAVSTDVRLAMGGKPMTITKFPALLASKLTMGRGFDGKMDEVMVWGSDRSGHLETDATVPYEWNVGNWDNDFLNAYWKGDDPDNPGKDYQSYNHMVEVMRSYYAGHTGARIRFGIVNGTTGGWLNVLANEENVDRLVASCQRLVTECDGLDVDLEWMYNASQWNVYNNIDRRLATEVMAAHPEKIFSCSLHNVSYNGFDKTLFPEVDYFTMQIYGPNPNTYTWDYYEQAYNNFIGYGYPADKLLLSYGTLVTDGKTAVEGYKDLFEKYGLDDAAYTPDLNAWNCNGNTKQFNGVTLVKRKQDFVVDKDVRGTMYFDMGNDLRVSDARSLIRAQNDVVAANVDTLVTAVELPGLPAGIGGAQTAGSGEPRFSVSQQDGCLRVVPAAEPAPGAYAAVYTADGRLVARRPLTVDGAEFPVESLPAGTCVVRVSGTAADGSRKVVIG